MSDRRHLTWGFHGRIAVDPAWVADGFELTDERIDRMVAEALARELPSATATEATSYAETLFGPSREELEASQTGGDG